MNVNELQVRLEELAARSEGLEGVAAQWGEVSPSQGDLEGITETRHKAHLLILEAGAMMRDLGEIFSRAEFIERSMGDVLRWADRLEGRRS